MVESVLRLRLFEVFRSGPLASANSSAQLLCESLVVSKRSQDRLMGKVCDVLCIVECGGSRRALVSLFSASGLLRMDTLENTETTKVRQRDL